MRRSLMAESSTPSHPSPEQTPIVVPENLVTILRTERHRFETMGARYAVHASRLTELEKRLIEGRFHLAVLGQVKRGKSTLLNALLGEDILPSAVVPLTAIPTFIRYGAERTLRVRYNDSRPDTVVEEELVQCSEDKSHPASHHYGIRWLQEHLTLYVTEEENPENQKGVREVEITLPAPILRDVVLIDTPGIGSVYRHNTEVTMNFLPQCDAALFLVSADPPITEVEVAFLREIKDRVARLFFVLNKVDYLTGDEKETALAFYRTVLNRVASIDPGQRIFAVSAKKGLLAKEANDTRLWDESGLQEVSDHLILFLASEKNRVLREAIGKKVFNVFCDAELQTHLNIRALELPLAELESRLSLFDKKIAEVEQQRLHAQDILLGDRKRVYDTIETYVKDLRIPLKDRLSKIAEDAMAASPHSPEKAAQDAVAGAIPGWFEHELGSITAMADREMTVRLREQGKRAEMLIESVRKGAAELFEIPYHAPSGEEVYHLVRKPYWVDHEWESTFSPVSSAMMERLLPGPLRQSRAKNRMKHQIDVLVMRNLENLRYETLQSIDAAFLQYSSTLDENLRLTIDATHGAVRAAMERRKEHAGETAGRLARLYQVAGELRDVLQLFGKAG
jgi:GTPase Era involved in 16S rRNA processing